MIIAAIYKSNSVQLLKSIRMRLTELQQSWYSWAILVTFAVAWNRGKQNNKRQNLKIHLFGKETDLVQ